jgi:hypothetical protein
VGLSVLVKVLQISREAVPAKKKIFNDRILFVSTVRLDAENTVNLSNFFSISSRICLPNDPFGFW